MPPEIYKKNTVGQARKKYSAWLNKGQKTIRSPNAKKNEYKNEGLIKLLHCRYVQLRENKRLTWNLKIIIILISSDPVQPFSALEGGRAEKEVLVFETKGRYNINAFKSMST